MKMTEITSVRLGDCGTHVQLKFVKAVLREEGKIDELWMVTKMRGRDELRVLCPYVLISTLPLAQI